MKEVKTGTYIRNDGSYNFNFYTGLSCANKLKFVDSVVDILVNDDNYNSVIRDLVFNFYIIDIFSDIDTSALKESSFFVNDVEQFLDETNIVDIIVANMEVGLLDELNRAVDQSIEYRTGIHTNPFNEALTKLINTLENKISEVDLDSMMNMVKAFSGMTDEFTPENVVNAYMNSDAHKKNLMDINENKNKRAEFATDMDKTIKVVNKNNAK